MSDFTPEAAIQALREPGRMLNQHQCNDIAMCIGRLCKKLAAAQQRQLVEDKPAAASWPSCNPWALAVDEALIAHSLDCTTPDTDPAKAVDDLLHMAVTMALDPVISKRAAALAGARIGGTEFITWTPVADRLPDADQTVNIATPSLNEPTGLGFFDGSSWYTAEGLRLDDGEVEAWAPMLVGLGQTAPRAEQAARQA